MNMSLESALDEERREVMNILEGRPADYRSPQNPEPTRALSPVAPVRSMLDIGPTTTRHQSIAGLAQPVSPPLRSAPLHGAMLEPMSPTGPTSKSAGASPSMSPVAGVHRASSDASSNIPDFGRHASPYGHDQFDMTSTVSGPALPKRNTLGGRKIGGSSAMASIMQGKEVAPLLPGERGRHNSTAGILGLGKSKSPSSRLNPRSNSPGTALLNNNSFNPKPTPGVFVSETGKVIDLNNAYRRLSDANFLKSGGEHLKSVPSQKQEARRRVSSGEILSPSGDLRLGKDYPEDEELEGAIESSDDERTSDDEAWGMRGRERRRKKTDKSEETEDSENDQPGRPRRPKSLLAAAEEERIEVSSKYKVQSLLEPTVTITGPGGEKLVTTKKSGIHPNTNYNAQLSRGASPNTSDSEDMNDIRRAQKLHMTMSPVDSSISNRVVRTIIRGEFMQMQHEAEEGLRRARTYLVATDLSAEAAYALEWTIGTVLRDGDTLMAVYCVDEEVGTGKTGETIDHAGSGVEIGQGGQAMADSAKIIQKLTLESKATPLAFQHSPLSGRPSLSVGHSRTGSVDSNRGKSKNEQERQHAIEDISQTCVKFLRKTKLQVRIAVEVIHCKNPKYMITEAIDVLEPTLVILGSRGRSALKGVLLGSFSNYLVTKSSVPVMVARRKLQKPNSKNRLPHIRLANNLTPSKSLAEAKID